MRGQEVDKSSSHDRRARKISGLSVHELKALENFAKGRNNAHKKMDQALLATLLSTGVIEMGQSGYVLNSAGRQALRRKCLQKEEEASAAQHQIRAIRANSNRSDPKEKIGSRVGNFAESPLVRLYLRKRADGSSYLTASQLEAGERLRRDFERGAISPSLGIDWSRLQQGTGGKSTKGHRGGRQDLSDSVHAARERFRGALIAVGHEFSGPLLDFCCFLKGLEDIERINHWPARSGKQILSMALSSLARHYGLEDEARGPDRSALRHWGEDGYRPSLFNRP